MATMDGKHTTKDEALDLALEALEGATPKYTRQRKDQKTLGGALDYWKLEQHYRLRAITAIKQARSAPVQVFDHVNAARQGLRDAQNRSRQISNLINCGTCGYPLAPEERTSLIERDSVMVKPAPVQSAERVEPVAHCEAGPNYCQQCHKESLPTYGSEEVRKLREVIKSQAKIIESNKPPPWFNAVENILKEYGLQAIDFVADFKAAIVDAEQHAAQPAPVVPDVMTTAEGEHPEYVQGWNDCRQLMLQTRNNRHD